MLGPLLVAVLVVYERRHQIAPGFERYVRYGTVLALLLLGWGLARDLGRAVGPQLLRRLDPSTAGSVGFLIRLVALLVAIVVALRIAGVHQSDLAVGGVFTAVVVGLAAQQTLGNLFAGMVLLSARPFRVGERVRFQAGNLAGTTEGIVESLGLMYITLSQGGDVVYLPNSAALSAAVQPLREPAGVDFTARLRPGVRTADVQRLLELLVDVPTRHAPVIRLESVDDEEVVVRIQATPVDADDGWRLADQVLAAIDRVVGEDITLEHVIGERTAPADRLGRPGADGPGDGDGDGPPPG
ncbi:mechanosensitive ion channel domain-containing protein [Baekduia soli]|uniref:mechanosensitive ion channel domain-containing protein n=1 Tax=Baekduia soli TaxID=496014 RepID=UPI001652138B|nr:mechanosensitive ion channel family protein [Baekduia soli]